ncbi:MAG TPA: tetratricopeptide repeat protein [Kofleriaceae bacterium]|jgi:tetratricopeptide (TPR) repeat protein
MVDSDRRPTAQEIEELIDLVRRDPSSPAFIDLGEAYLALGRPKDAVAIGNVGIQAAPDSLEGRVMLARAYAQLHQWKEAQGELLRVVKVDRSSRQGFALLGEVLLRRQDYERAVPVLQHAQNLDPTSPQILAMLKRARANQSLDPPAPIPSPVPPRGETNYGLQLDPPTVPPARSAPPAPPPLSAKPTNRSGPMAAMPQPPRSAPMAAAAMPTLLEPDPSSALWGGDVHSPPQTPARAMPLPVPSPEGVRPRIVAQSRPQNAAAASLRQSAAVGENYLNELLTGGLLDVAGVRVPDADFDLRPDRRWGRSTRRAFIFLFAVLVLGIGGGGTWYWWSQKQNALAVAGLQREAKAAIVNGDFAGLELGITKLGDAVKRDPNNALSIAYAAETTGLEALLYGTDADRVDQALKGARDIKDGEPGWREMVIGKSAVELSRLAQNEAASTTLAEVQKSLDTYLGKHDDDRWARWLKGRALLAAGQRNAGKAEIKKAAEGADGLVVAMIDQADLLVDDGALDEAFAIYDKALAKSKDHPLAVLGKSLARAESSVQSTDAIDDLNVKLDKPLGPRVSAYRNLALALADAGIEEYAQSLETLRKSMAGKNPPAEPRFLARVAWAHYARGELAEAANARKPIAWYGGKGTKPEPDPVVMLVDASLLLASGLPEKALDVSSKLAGVRASLLRGYADLDLGKYKDAISEATDVSKKAPDNVEAQIVLQWATMVQAATDKNDKDRQTAADALEHLARKTKSKIGRHALGMAYYMIGDFKNAQPQLEQAIADVSDDQPNPLSYRTRTALADILLSTGDIAGAGKQLDEALKVNSGYFPALAMQAKVVLKNGDPDRALDLLGPLSREDGAMTPVAQLVEAEALCTHKKDATAKDKTDAEAILTSLKDKATPEDIGRAAFACDPKLPEKLGVPVPSGDPTKPATTTTHHHHHQ